MNIKKHKILLTFFDILCIYISILFAFWISTTSGNITEDQIKNIGLFFMGYSYFGIIKMFLLIPVLIINNLYNYNVLLNISRHIMIIVKSSFIGTILLILFLLIVKSPILYERYLLSLDLIILMGIFIIFRVLLLHKILKFAIRKKIIGKNVVLIGAGDLGCITADSLLADKFSYFTPIGFIDDNINKVNHELPIIGKINEIKNVSNKFNEIIISINNISFDNLHSIIEKCRSTKKTIHILSNLYGIIPLKRPVYDFDYLQAFSITEFDPGLIYKIVKGIIDRTISLFLLIIFLPVWILVAMIIKFNSRGPVFYKQKVIGKNEKPFIWYKFRTMVHNANDNIHRQLVQDMATGVKTDGKKLQNDDRITSVGKVLRKFSIDEFPQLINVLQGAMSLVGPRPIADYELELLKHWQKIRFKVIPGITGPWQVMGRDEVGFNDQNILDKYYVENQSLLLDFEILLKTIPVVIFGKGGK